MPEETEKTELEAVEDEVQENVVEDAVDKLESKVEVGNHRLIAVHGDNTVDHIRAPAGKLGCFGVGCGCYRYGGTPIIGIIGSRVLNRRACRSGAISGFLHGQSDDDSLITGRYFDVARYI